MPEYIPPSFDDLVAHQTTVQADKMRARVLNEYDYALFRAHIHDEEPSQTAASVISA